MTRRHPGPGRGLGGAAAPRLGSPRWIPAEALGQPPHATVRVLLALPGKGLAAGTDYGLALLEDGRWTPFPFPSGSRREARRVEAMAIHDGALCVATQKSWFTLNLETRHVRARGLPRDEVGGHDDVRCMLAVGGRLLVGWRRHLEGARGPPETFCLAAEPGGRVYAGTADGRIVEVDGDGSTLRHFTSGGRPCPVRHLAVAEGALWAAAAGALHRFDGDTWEVRRGEPVALATEPSGRLWGIRDGHVAWHGPSGLVPLSLPVARPWVLGFASDALWVGAVGGLLHVPLLPGSADEGPATAGEVRER